MYVCLRLVHKSHWKQQSRVMHGLVTLTAKNWIGCPIKFCRDFFSQEFWQRYSHVNSDLDIINYSPPLRVGGRIHPPRGWGVNYAPPEWGRGRIRLLFPPSSSRKRVSRWQRVYIGRLRRSTVLPLPGCRLKTLPPFTYLSCPIPTQPLLQMVQHGADWVSPFPLNIPLFPINSSTVPLHLSPLLLSLMCERETI